MLILIVGAIGLLILAQASRGLRRDPLYRGNARAARRYYDERAKARQAE